LTCLPLTGISCLQGEKRSERKKSRALDGYPALLPHKEEKGVCTVYSKMPKKK
jgi:hypothetical protein